MNRTDISDALDGLGHEECMPAAHSCFAITKSMVISDGGHGLRVGIQTDSGDAYVWTETLLELRRTRDSVGRVTMTDVAETRKR